MSEPTRDFAVLSPKLNPVQKLLGVENRTALIGTGSITTRTSVKFRDLSQFFDEVPEAESFDAIAWSTNESFAKSAFGEIANRLAEDGRVVLVHSQANEPDTVIAASEAGFVRRRRVPLDQADADHDGGRFASLWFPTDYVVRPLEEDDIEDVLGMFAPSFHSQRSAAHWHWKFDHNPFGQRKVSIARHRNGALAAHYAGYPVVFRDIESDRKLVGLQIGDTMTAPEFRAVGRGPTSLLVRTIAHFFASHCTNQVGFNFGFNAGNIQRFSFRFIGAQPVEPVPYWEAKVDELNLPSLGYAVRRLTGAELGFDRRLNRFFERAAPHYKRLVERSSRWLRWRYLDCPDAPAFRLYGAFRWGRLVGWSVFRDRGESLLWCDSLTVPKHRACAASLLRAGLEERAAENEGNGPTRNSVQAWFPDRPQWWAKQLEALGLRRATDPNDLSMVCNPMKIEDTVGFLQSCYYTMGDSDLV